MQRRALTALRPQSYEHSLDKRALDALQQTGGLETLVRKVNDWGLERMIRAQLTGSHLLVTADSDPELHGLLQEAREILDVPLLPELYVAQQGEINAFTSGVQRPVIVLSAEAVDALSHDELRFLLGHELGHVKSAHVLYYQIAEFVPVLGGILGGVTLGLGELAGAGLNIALLNWKRMSELTADRAGLLACQDANVALSVLMKVSGLPRNRYDRANTEDFIAQARAFDSMDSDTLGWIAKRLAAMGASHPWTVHRARELLNWIDDGSYDRVLSVDHGAALPTAGAPFCTGCGARLESDDVFCSGCGTRLRVLAAV